MNYARATDQMLGELNRRLKADYDLSISAANVLAIIDGAGEPITPGVIAERAIIAAASTTSVLDTLEKTRAGGAAASPHRQAQASDRPHSHRPNHHRPHPARHPSFGAGGHGDPYRQGSAVTC